MKRLLALSILVIPGVLAAIGFKLMRDVIFAILKQPFPYLWVQFAAGLLVFVMGLLFIGGFILHRDRKNSKVQSRFRQR